MGLSRYLVVDLMNGGDLRFHISRKTFTEDAVRFWISELGCALKYIHKQGIIHRDVKPDNVLLDSEGHIHLADFVRPIPNSWRSSMLTVPRTLRPISHPAKCSQASPEPWHISRQRSTRVLDTLQGQTGGHWAFYFTSAYTIRSEMFCSLLCTRTNVFFSGHSRAVIKPLWGSR